MPRATYSADPKRIELKSCPGGWVEIKQLPYYDMLERRDKAMQMSMQTGQNNVKDQKLFIDTFNKWTAQFDFANCIHDHNLEDDKGQKLDFTNPLTLKVLEPRIALEIEAAIADLNQEEEKSVEDFTSAPSSSSSDMTEMPSKDTAEV